MTTSGRERRQFGRRTTCLHAWIRIPGRPPLACIVRNLSVQGAFLELPMPEWLPYTFQLRIDASRFVADCELRHKGARGCGVMFADELPIFDALADSRVLDSETWTGQFAPSVRRDRH